MNLEYIVQKSTSINQVLSELDLSTRLKSKLIKNKCVLSNGIFVDTRNIVEPGTLITVVLDTPEDNSNIVPTKMNLDIIYEDEHLLAINKPAGIAVHPSILHFEDSLSNGVKYYFDTINLSKKIRPINRIDLNTSGLVLFAKNEYIQECLIKQMASNSFKKTYLCLVREHLNIQDGTIDFPIARKDNSIIERCVSSSGQPAITHYRVLNEFENYSLVECELETGRTHQIRVHFAHIENPLLGDTLYNTFNDVNLLINRQALHSYKMDFFHPVVKKNILIEAEIPEDMKKLIKIPNPNG